MDALQAWGLILGFLTPLLVALVNQPRFTPTQKRLISVFISILVGVINLLVQGALSRWSLDLTDLLANFALVLGAAQAAYALLWKPTGVSDKVEAATSKGDVDLAA